MRALKSLLVVCAFAAMSLPLYADNESVTLPDLNPAEWFDGKMGGTFGAKTVTAFAKSNRVAIGGFRVVFVTHNEARAFTGATYLPGGVERGSSRAKMEVDLQGVDDATMQAITDRAYQRFVDQLKAAGREVVTLEELQPTYTEFKTAPTPMAVDVGLLKGKAFAPTGMPLWWQIGDSWGDAGLGQKNMRAFNKQAAALKGTICVAPMVVIDFAHMESSGNKSGLIRRTAEVGASLAMSVPAFYTRVVRAEEVRYGGIVSKGDDGALSLTKALDTDIEFAELFAVNEKTGTVLALSGADNKTRKWKKVAKTTNEAYTAAADAVLGQATGAFAKLFVTNPVRK